jgi:subtilase family serine protease
VLRDSFTTHSVLADLDPDYSTAARAAYGDWAEQATLPDNDARARLLLARGPNSVEVAGALADAQRADGGWGLDARHESSPLDTALALQALAGRQDVGDVAGPARGYLLATQNGDGGWGAVAGGPSQIGVTAQVLRALGRDAATAGIRQAAGDWLRGRQNGDGSVGHDDNRIAATAQTLWALADTDDLEGLDVAGAVNFLKGRQGQNGSWDNSVFNTALVVKALGRVQFGNWTVTNLTTDTDSLYDGQRLTLEATIQNDGNVPTPGTTVALYLGDPENGGVQVDSLEIPAIGIGQGVQVSFDWDSLDNAGDQSLYLVIDPDNLLDERTELDNSASVDVSVTPPADGVDLIAGGIELMPATITALPTTTGLSAVVRNAGTQAAGGVTIEWWVDNNDGSSLLHSEQVALAERSDTPVNATFDWTTPGSHTFRLVVDAPDAVSEVDEGNNEAARTATTQDGLDLAVEPSDIALRNTPAYGQTLEADVTVHNRGTVISPAFDVEIFLQGEGEQIPLDTVQMTLAGGESRTLDVPWAVDRTGTYELIARIDPGAQVAELSEDNNEAGQSFTAQVVDGNNLKVSFETLGVSPEPLLEGYGATLSAGIQNTGNQPATNVKVHFFDGKPGEGGVVVAQASLPDVQPGSSATAQAVWDSVPTDAERSVYVVVDPDNAIDEFDETDNQAFRVVAVDSLPDLALAEGALTLTPPLVAEGETFEVKVDVANLGKQAADDVRVTLYWDGISDAGLMGDQRVTIPANSETTLSFVLSANTLGERQVFAAVDVDDEILEQSETNNRQSRDVMVQDGEFFIDNPYISPDGDGVKDSVTLFYKAEAAPGSYLSVEDRRGKEVRRILLDDIQGSGVEWHGRNEVNGLVGDGRYSLILRGPGGDALGSASVVVDNNRSPLTDAMLEEDRGYRADITCELPTDEQMNWALSEDEQSVYFDKNGADVFPGAPNGIYRGSVSGDSVERLALLDDFPDAEEITYLATNKAGDRTLFGVVRRTDIDGSYYWPSDIYEVRPGQSPQLLMSFDSEEVASATYGNNGDTAYISTTKGFVRIYNASEGDLLSEVDLSAGGNFWNGVVDLSPNADESAILINVMDEVDWYAGRPDNQSLLLLDTRTDAVTELASHSYEEQGNPPQFSPGGLGGGSVSEADIANEVLCQPEEDCSGERSLSRPMAAKWSPDGDRFVLTGKDSALYLHSSTGQLLERFPLQGFDPRYWQDLSSVAWSPESDRVSFHHGVELGLFRGYGIGGFVRVLDIETGGVRELIPYYYERPIPQSFAFYTWDGETWKKRGETHHGIKMSEETINLRPFLPDPAGRFRVRVVQEGHEEGFADHIAMRTPSGSLLAPDSATLLADNRDISGELASRDKAMVDLHESYAEIEWSADNRITGKISLYAQEASPSAIDLKPFLYSPETGEGFRMPLSADRALTVDGAPDSNPGKPLFKTYSRPDTAHKPAYVYGYATSDDKFLYAALDFTVDSTSENRGDWAALEVRTGEGWQRFRIDVDDRRWGQVQFVTSENADWPHRYYEFKVPLDQVGLEAADVAEVRFRAYGSAGELGNPLFDGVSYNARVFDEPIWLPSDDALWYQWQDNYRRILRFRDDAEVYTVVNPDNRIVGKSPKGRRVLYRDDPPEGSCNLDQNYNEVKQVYAFDTLDNLTVDFRVYRSPGTGAFRIQGTVTDRHFDRYTLEYSENGESDWRPVRPAGTSEYVDELITSWVPPERGKYFVRLTGFDKAGNALSAIRQVVWSNQPPISDIYLDQDLFSPNADGTRDELGVHFKVRSPVNLAVQIYDQGNNLVRNFDRSYDVVGEDAWIYWDGRDEAGRVVPDGEYRIEVMGIDFYVSIDNTYPVVDLVRTLPIHVTECLTVGSLSAPDRTAIDGPGGVDEKCLEYRGEVGFLAMNYGLKASAFNEVGEDTPITFSLEASPLGEDDWSLKQEGAGERVFELNEQELSQYKYRISSTDGAGNKAVLEYRPENVQQVSIIRSGPYQPDIAVADDMGKEFAFFGEPIPFRGKAFGPVRNVSDIAHITLSETILSPVSAVYAEHKRRGDDQWVRDQVTQFLESNWSQCKSVVFKDSLEAGVGGCNDRQVTSSIGQHEIHLLWDMKKLLSLSDINNLRFVIQSAGGEEYITQTVDVFPISFGIKGFRNTAILDPNGLGLVGEAYASDALARIDFYVKSEVDDRFSEERLLGTIRKNDLVTINNKDMFAVDATNLEYCNRYDVRAQMTSINGNAATVEGGYDTPCMRSVYSVAYPDQLNKIDRFNQATVYVWPVSLGTVPLKSLELYVPISSGERDVLATRTDIDNGMVVRFDVDTSSWPAGEVDLALRLVDENDNVVTENFSLYRDLEYPDLEMPYPLDGNYVCGNQPFQINYSDRSGGPSGSGIPQEWNHEGQIYGAIDNIGNPTSLIYGERVSSRVNVGEILATNYNKVGVKFQKAIDQSDIGPAFSARPELLVEALDSQGNVLDSFALWDKLDTKLADFPDLVGPSRVGDDILYRDFVALPWQLSSRDGGAASVKIRLTGTDAFGNASVLSRDVFIDTAARSPVYRVEIETSSYSSGSFVYISPNGDGVQDSISVIATNYEPGNFEWRLYPSEIGSDTQPIGVLSSLSGVGEGEFSLAWDGKLNGSVVEDGEYRIEPVLVDGCGNESQIADRGVTIVVDTQAPVISSVSPASGSPVALQTELGAVITETNLDVSSSEALGQYYRSAGTLSETPIERSVRREAEEAYEVSGTWNTFGLAGEYELVWRVSDLAGNLSEEIVPVSLLQKADLLSSLVVDTPFVSPNADGRQDRLRYGVGVLEPVDLRVDLLDSNGNIELILFEGEQSPGDRSFVADLATTGGFVPDGQYRVRATATSLEFPSLQQDVSAALVVDTDAPEVTLPTVVEGFLQPPYELTAAINDPVMGSYRVTIDAPEYAETLAEGSGNLDENSLRTLDESDAQGDYVFSLRAEDKAGNLTDIRLPFELDTQAPEIVWQEPSVSVAGGEDFSLLPWRLSANDPNPGNLNVVLRDDQASEVELYDGVPAEQGLSGEADVGELSGDYSLVAAMSDRAGNERVVSRAIHIDHTAPVVSLDSPAANEYLTGDFSVVGQVQDRNLARWTLALFDQSGQHVIDLDTREKSVSGDLGTYPVVQDGDYLLRLTAQDAVGYSEQVETPVRIDTTPPQAADSLAVSAVSEGTYSLSWSISAPADVSHYLVFDKSGQVAGPIATTEWSFEAVENRDYFFTVVAIDEAGLESEPSEALLWTLDTQGPAAGLSAPVDGALVSGLVDVIGSVTADDLDEYTVAVGASGSAGWRQLSESSLARRGERLAQWSTLDEPGDGDYVIRLRAADQSGNITEDTTTVTVDNTPPEAPASLDATATGNDVAVDWQDSPSTDVQGYLLLRNDTIVNADGPVIGDTTPYLIDGNAYADNDVVDGDHVYLLYAMDLAGNLSEPAQANVDIDLTSPALSWQTPSPGQSFENSIALIAVSDAEDIATVRFRYRSSGDSAWTDLTPDISSAPFVYSWDTQALSDGDYEIQAEAWDQGGRNGLTPVRSITRRDLTAPDAPASVVSAVDGASVTLDWPASPSQDVAEYVVQLIDSDGNASELARVPSPGTDAVVQDLLDGSYRFRVLAVDQAGNLSTTSPEVTALVFTPLLDPIESITVDGTMVLKGSVPVGDSVAIYRDVDGQPELISELSITNDGRFQTENLNLQAGENRFLFRAETQGGDRSKFAEQIVIRATAPGPVRDLGYEFSDPQVRQDVELAWLEPLESPDVFYVVRDDDGLLNGSYEPVPVGYVSSSDAPSWGALQNAFDDDPFSSFRPYDADWELEIDYPQLVWVDEVEMFWDAPPATAELSIKVSGVWRTLETLTLEGQATPEWRKLLETPQPVTAIRLKVSGDTPSSLLALSVGARQVTMDRSFVYNGGLKEDKTFRVSAVNAYGLEGEQRSVSAQLGDWVGPEAVSLSASVSQSDVQLDWTASPSQDVARYLVYRDGEPVANLASPDSSVTSWQDQGVANGIYGYQVRPIDLAGNLGDYSNAVPVTVSAALPDAPATVSASPDATTGCIDLSWDSSAAAVSYQVLRSDDGQRAEVVESIEGTAYTDCDLYPDVEYQYQVVAVDLAGNNGQAASSQPQYAVDDVPPQAPMILLPVPEGETFEAATPRIDIAGMAEPGSTVTLLRNGFRIGQTGAATGGTALERYQNPAVDYGRLSPNGKKLALLEDQSMVIREFPSGDELAAIASIPGEINDIAWVGDQRIVALSIDAPFGGQPSVVMTSLSLDDGSVAPLYSNSYTNTPQVNNWYLDRQKGWFVLGVQEEGFSGDYALSTIDADTGASNELMRVSGTPVFVASISPSGDKVLWEGFSGTQIREVGAGTDSSLPCDGGAVSWRSDPEQPILDTANGLVACDTDSGTTSLLYQGPDFDGVTQFSSLPSGIRIMTLSDQGDGTAAISVFDGTALNQIGSIPYDPAAGTRVEGFLEDGRIWFTENDPGSGEYAVGLTGKQTNFEFSDIKPGSSLNSFRGYAEDRFGNRSEQSGAIQVIAPAVPVSNLSVSLSVPQAVTLGYPVPISAVVTNTGNQAMPATDLKISLFDADGDRTTLLQDMVPDLAAGESMTFEATWIASRDGVAVAEAVVDTSRSLSEDDRSDNFDNADLRISALQQLFLNLDSGAVSGKPGENRYLRWSLINPGLSSYQGQLHLEVIDEYGVAVADLGTTSASPVAGGETLSGTRSFVVPALQPGEYGLRLSFRSSGVDYPVSADAVLNVESDLQISALVSSTANTFTANQSVPVSIDITHAGVSGVLSNARINLAVADSQGAVLEQWEQGLPALLPGDAQRHEFTWNTGTMAPGNYRFEMEIVDGDGNIEVARNYTFAIAAGVPKLVGTLELESDVVGLQRSLPASWMFANEGNTDLSNVAVSVEAVREPASSAELNVSIQDIAVAETISRQHLLDTSNLSAGSWTIRLVADLDYAGNSYRKTLASSEITVRDIDAPQVTIVAPVDSAFVNSERISLVARVSDSGSGIGPVQWRRAGGAWTPMTLAGDGHTASLAGLPEGERIIEVRASDTTGNVSRPVALTVTVDNTAPAVSITDVEGGRFYNEFVQPVVSVTDTSPVSVAKQLNGIVWSGQPVMNEAVHAFRVEAIDAAGNQSKSSVMFTIDMTSPVIAVGGVVDGALYNHSVTPEISANDSWLDDVTVLLDAQPYVPGTPVQGEGEHVLDIQASDQAGNESSRVLTFIIDTMPPSVPVISSIQPGEVINQTVVDVAGSSEPGAQVELVTSTGSFITIVEANGTYRFASVGFPEGENSITVTATDEAGNDSVPTTLTFTVQPDSEPPIISITGVADSGYYATAVAPEVDIQDESALGQTDIALNGNAYEPGTPIEGDGEYTLVVSAEDEFGNATSQSLSFHIDTLAPELVVTGVSEGGLYNSTVTPDVSVTDASPVTVSLLLDGQPFSGGDLVDSEGVHELVATATDSAGNETVAQVSFELDLTAPPAPVVDAPVSGGTVAGPTVAISGSAEPGAELLITLAGSIFTTDAGQAGTFSYQTALEDGEYQLQVLARDAAGNQSQPTLVPFTVSDVEISLTAGGANSSKRVLLWKADSGGHYQDGVETNWYVEKLRELDIPVTSVGSESEFRQELASQNHNILLLAGPGGDFGLPLQMSQDTLVRVRGSVASGYGLAWINARPNLLEFWHDMIGARTVSKMHHSDGVSYPVDNNTVLESGYPGIAAGIFPLGGTERGEVDPDCDADFSMWLLCAFDPAHFPAAMENNYGRGKVKALTFALEALSDEDAAEQILDDLISDVVPDALPNVQYLPALAGLRVDRDYADTRLAVTVSVPQGLELLPIDASQVIDAQTASWEVPAGQTRTRIAYRIRGLVPGEYQVGIQVHDADTGAGIEETTYPFVLERSATEMLEQLEDDARQAFHERPWLLTLLASKEALEWSVSAYESGNYQLAYDKLYIAMIKLRLTPGYSRNLMAQMGDYQRLLIALKDGS